jgi:glycerol kinase
MLETTALGAAFLAGLGAAVWSSKTEIAGTWREARRLRPAAPREQITAHLERWNAAVSKA